MKIIPDDEIQNVKRLLETVKIVDKNGCWLKKDDDNTYAIIWFEKKCFKAHRLSYEIFKGNIPKDKFVCHNCPNGDNPKCFNPDHLWIGTNRENNQDWILKTLNKYVKTLKDENISLRKDIDNFECYKNTSEYYRKLFESQKDITKHYKELYEKILRNNKTS